MHNSTKEEVLNKADLIEVIEDFYTLEKAGASFYTTCPLCGKTGKGKGLTVNKSKKLCKCFSCDWGTKSAATFLMETQSKTYPEALDYLAQKYQIIDKDLYTNDVKKKKKAKSNYKTKTDKATPAAKKTKKRANELSFCDQQLKESGLKVNDILALIPSAEKEGEVREVECFTKGTKNEYGKIVDGDDMIIHYYDLEGRQVMYQDARKKEQPFYRIRWENPGLHTDKNDKPMKYQSPPGSGTKLYIPQHIRAAYQRGTQIPILFLQEGEKKSEKACKHGLPSVGLSGINAIGQGSKNQKTLPYELQLLVKRCNVEKVIFIFDSDWKDISTKLFDGVYADQRPKNFYYAARNFRDYFTTFTGMGIYLELFIAGLTHPKDKGVDDLLANSLKDHEDDLIEDITTAITQPNGKGNFIQTHKISDWPNLKLRELWHLHDAHDFAEVYRSKLIKLKEFSINKTRWRFKDGKLEMAQPMLPQEYFYENRPKIDKEGGKTDNWKFNHYSLLYHFLPNRGFGRIEMADSSFKLCRVENNVVEILDSYKIKDFCMNFALNATEKAERVEAMNMLLRNAKNYFGPDNLSQVKFVYPEFEINSKDSQNLYFQKEFWKITAKGIEAKDYSEIERNIWKDNIRDFAAKRTDKLFRINKVKDDIFEVIPSEDGSKCHFASYVWNTGDFYWGKHIYENQKDERTEQEKQETALQFVAKMSAMGYLLHGFFDASTPKAIIGMDGKLSEVGKSNGGSGKSIFGDAIGQIITQASIGAKNKKLTEDPFIFEEVNEKTANVFLDDVRVNLDFEFLFPYITGKFLVNGKGDKKFTIPAALTPKIYISTNHAVNGEGSSFRRRQFMIPFSDYYNDKHSPRDDFGVNFFTEWDYYQRNLFFNFGAECVQVYLQHGLVQPPTQRLELRRMRQKIGEDFISWADEFFNYDDEKGYFDEHANKNINNPIPRPELTKSFTTSDHLNKKYASYWTAKKFGESFREYCKFRNCRFNPKKIKPDSETIIGGVDKSGGVEYYTVQPIDEEI